MSLARIRAVLANEIGLTDQALPEHLLARVVRLRAAALGLDPTAYPARLELDRDERAAMIDEVVVPETWFLRDQEPFRAIARRVARWPGGRRLRALSLPCSTGEEPYSLVMTVADAGLELGRIDVVAVDISRPALARAARARYGANSFRGVPDELRARHFSAVEDGWQLDPRLRARVELIRANALAVAAAVTGRFDIILCRNLFIYLHREARQRLLADLVALLAEGGALVLGHADLIDPAAHGLVRADEPSAFMFQADPRRRGEIAGGRSAVPAAPRRAPLGSRPPATRSPLGPAADRRPIAGSSPGAVVAEARALADAGQLDAAAGLLAGHLARSGPDSALYHLLGVIDSARGDHARAEQHLTRALYCDPGHRPSLVHLALLCEQRGETARAANFRRRAARARGGDRGRGR